MGIFFVFCLVALSAASNDHSAQYYESSLKHDQTQDTQSAKVFKIESADVHSQAENVASRAPEDRKIFGLKSRWDEPSMGLIACFEGDCIYPTSNEAIRAQSDSRTSNRRRKHKNSTPNVNSDFLAPLRSCSAATSALLEEASRHGRLKSTEAVPTKLTRTSRSFVINMTTARETFEDLAPFYLPTRVSSPSQRTWPKDKHDEERDLKSSRGVPLPSSRLSSSDKNNDRDGFQTEKKINEDTSPENMEGPLAIMSSHTLKPLKDILYRSDVRELTSRESRLASTTSRHSDMKKSFQIKNGQKTGYNRQSSTTTASQNVQDKLQGTQLKQQQKESQMQLQERDGPSIEISSECNQAVSAIYDAFNGVSKKFNVDAETALEHFWYLKFLDAWGKGEDGLFMGNLRKVGLMEECLHAKGHYKDPSTGHPVNFTGQYCTIAPVAEIGPVSGWLPPLYGTCMPSSCTAQELKDSVTVALSDLNYTAEEVWCRQRDPDLPWHTWDYVGCSAIGVMVLMVVLATVAHAAMENVPKVVRAFSAADNYNKISTIKMDSKGQITCFYGIRVLSICWVILGHHYAYMSGFGYNLLMMSWMTQDWAFQIIWTGYKAVDTFFTIGGLLTTQAIVKMDFLGTSRRKKKSVPAQPSNTHETANHASDVAVKAGLSTDEKPLEMSEIRDLGSKNLEEDAETGSPIENSGITEPSKESNKEAEEAAPLTVPGALVNFFKTYAVYVCHRLMRLLPTLFLITMFCAGPSSFLVDGPNRRRYEEEYITPCRTNWWVDLTLFSNVIFRVFGEKADADPDFGPVDSCISHSWYLAVDFQLYLAAPLLLLPLKYQLKNYGVWYLSVVALVFCLVPGILVLAEDLLPAMLITLDEKATLEYSRRIYMMPYARAAPYFFGGVCGLLLLQDKATPEVDGVRKFPLWRRLLESKEVRAGGWLVFLIAFGSVTFGLYGSNEVSWDVHKLSDAESFFYASFATAAWAICVCWVVLLCALQLAGPVNDFLSHPFWQVPCRVSYPVYLVSLPIQKWIFYSLLTDVYLSHLTIVLTYCGVLVISFMAAFCISIVAEAPYIGLSKIVFEPSRK